MARSRRRGRWHTKPNAKKRLAWTRGVFGNTVDQTGTPPDLTESVLFDPALDAVGGSAGADFNRKWNVRRAIVRGGLLPLPLTTAFQFAGYVMIQALYVIDREDADNTLLTTNIGDILEGGVERLLYTNVLTFCVNESTGTAVNPVALWNPPRIDIDWKGNVKMGMDELLVYGSQVTVDVSGALSTLTEQFVTSVLFETT